MASLFETIQKRRSCRTFSSRPVEPALLDEINNFLMHQKSGPLGTEVSFQLINFSDELTPDRVPGTYGFIKGARLFVAGLARPTESGMRDFGYCMEKILLFLTDLGLGTCWLGASFQRDRFFELLQAPAGWVMPAISPVGYVADKASMKEKVIRWGAKSHARKPWDTLFFMAEGQTPLGRQQADSFEQALEAVRLAPSASNKQPWRIIRQDEPLRFHLFLQRTKGYGRMKSGVMLQDLDMGIAMCHFELVARDSGLAGSWTVSPPSDFPPQWEYGVTWK